MTAPALPAELKAALDARLQGLSRNDATERASLISQTYRDGGGSSAIRSEADALAYALARMPATYAAVTASLNALREITPDFAPTSLLDVGAGPGTATWAAAAAFPSLTSFALLDANCALGALALDLGRDSPRLGKMTYQLGEARAALADCEAADLVIASYMIGEIGKNPRHAADRRARYARGLWPDDRAAEATDRGRRACRSPLPARRRMSASSAGLVSLHATAAAVAGAQTTQIRRTSL
jgi:ribosomal protein RSM22 (predicted rRNA methylase)